jgi:hypothetical protein
MITALGIRAPAVAIRFQPANDTPLGAPDLPTLAGSLARRKERRWPEAVSEPRLDLCGLAWSDESPTAARHAALLRQLIVEEAKRTRIDLRTGEVACRIQLFRDQFRIHSAAAMRDWLAHAGITFDKLAGFFRAELLMEKVEQAHWARLEREREAHAALLVACAELRRPRAGSSAGDQDAAFMAHATSDIRALMGQESSDRALRRRLLLRVLATRELWRRGRTLPPGEVDEMSARFRASFGLVQASETRRWLSSSGLSQEAFSRQMWDFAAVIKLEQERADAIAAGITLGNAIKTAGAWSARRGRAC